MRQDDPPRPRPPLWRELLIGLGTFLVVMGITRISLSDKEALALAHARDVLQLQEQLGLGVEPALNHWLATQGVLTIAANYYYASGYIVVSVATFVYLYLARPGTYRWSRRTAVVINVLATLCFVLFPLAPPRLNPGMTIVDTVTKGHTLGSWGTPVAKNVNQLAAMPSLHFALALWVLLMLMMAQVARVVRLLAAAHVVLTLFVIVATGNHYLLDAAAALVLVAVGVLATLPRVWWPRLSTQLSRGEDITP